MEASSEICANWFCQTSTERRALLLLDLLDLGWQIYASCWCLCLINNICTLDVIPPEGPVFLHEFAPPAVNPHLQNFSAAYERVAQFTLGSEEGGWQKVDCIMYILTYRLTSEVYDVSPCFKTLSILQSNFPPSFLFRLLSDKGR